MDRSTPPARPTWPGSRTCRRAWRPRRSTATCGCGCGVPPSLNVYVIDYRGAPYLHFDRDGVFVNHNSSMYFLNQVPPVTPSTDLGAGTRPDWHRATTGHTYVWHDGRLHARRDPGAPARRAVRRRLVGAAADRRRAGGDPRRPVLRAAAVAGLVLAGRGRARLRAGGRPPAPAGARPPARPDQRRDRAGGLRRRLDRSSAPRPARRLDRQRARARRRAGRGRGRRLVPVRPRAALAGARRDRGADAVAGRLADRRARGWLGAAGAAGLRRPGGGRRLPGRRAPA